jgi:predicted lipoprotein
MKLEPREYNDQETAIIESCKMQIQSLQSEIEDRWQTLIRQLNVPDKIPNPETDYLWDYIMNDFI